MIYHITSLGDWRAACQRGYYSAASLADEGFIHCSTRAQVLLVANAAFRGQQDLLLLCIDESKLKARLLWENPAHPQAAMGTALSDEALFPHLYGELNLEAVMATRELCETATGFALPADLP